MSPLSSSAVLLSCLFGMPAAALKWKALFVVGTPEDAPLYADKIYKDKLEEHGYEVVLKQDTKVALADCSASQIMLISATISGSAVSDKLNNCSTPSMIWESRLFSIMGMAADVEEAQRVTSAFFHENHETAWTNESQIPPLPTGSVVQTVFDAQVQMQKFWTVDDYGMNYISRSKLGAGVKIYAALPADRVADSKLGFTDPEELKATYFVYQKGAELHPSFETSKSPAFRIAWPVFGNVYGRDPSCEELATVSCASCKRTCRTRDEMISAIQNGENPMPLSEEGLLMLDKSISWLTYEARKEQQQFLSSSPETWAGPPSHAGL